MTVIVNGLPLVQIELKRPGVEINEAINQINRYRAFSFKGLFRYLQLFVVSNSVQTKYFCNENEMDNGKYNPILKSLVFFWTDENNKRINTLDEFTAEFFRKAAITEMIDKFMVIKTAEPVLMVMRPYQIYAVKAAKKRVLEANQNGYVFACTGSGKTLTSITTFSQNLIISVLMIKSTRLQPFSVMEQMRIWMKSETNIQLNFSAVVLMIITNCTVQRSVSKHLMHTEKILRNV